MNRVVFDMLAVIAIPCVCGVVAGLGVLGIESLFRWRQRHAQRAWERAHGLEESNS